MSLYDRLRSRSSLLQVEAEDTASPKTPKQWHKCLFDPDYSLARRFELTPVSSLFQNPQVDAARYFEILPRCSVGALMPQGITT